MTHAQLLHAASNATDGGTSATAHPAMQAGT